MLSFIGNNQPKVSRVMTGLASVSLADACFPLTHKPLFYYDANNMAQQTGHKALMAADTEEILYVGSEYNPVPNADIYTTLAQLEQHGWQIESIKALNRRVFGFSLVHPEMTFQVGGLVANARLVVINSYDGSQALKVFTGGVIQVCSNGLIIGKGVEYSRKHRGLAVGDFEQVLLDTVENGLKESLKKVEAKEWELEDMTKLEKMWKSLTKGFPNATNGQPAKIVNALNQRFFEEQRRGYKGELGMMMAATHIVTHDYAQHSGGYILQLEAAIPKVFFN